MGYKAAGVIHWVSSVHGVAARVRRYGHLFGAPDPLVAAGDAAEGEAGGPQNGQGSGADEQHAHAELLRHLNPNSLEEFDAIVEPSVATAVRDAEATGGRCWWQFEREGYYTNDERLDADGQPEPAEGTERGLVLNMVVGLRSKPRKQKGRKKAKKQRQHKGPG